VFDFQIFLNLRLFYNNVEISNRNTVSNTSLKRITQNERKQKTELKQLLDGHQQKNISREIDLNVGLMEYDKTKKMGQG